MKDDDMDTHLGGGQEFLADRRLHGLLLAFEETRSTGDAFVTTVVAAWAREDRGRRARTPQPSRRMTRWFIAATSVLAVGAAFAFVTRGTPPPERQSQSLATAPSRNQDPSDRGPAPPPPAFSDPSPDHKPTAADSARTVLSLDFEDGDVPPLLVSGAVVPGPAREGNRFCVLAGVNEWALRTNTIMLEARANGVFRYDRRHVLRFAYWMGPGTAQISVQIRNGDRNLNYNFGFQPRVYGSWAQAVIPLSSFAPFDKVTAMQDGDMLVDLFIVGGPLGGAPLFVDDIQVTTTP